MKNGTPSGPLSAVKKSHGFVGQERSEGRIEQQERQEAEEKKNVRTQKMDKVTGLLDDPMFSTEFTWDFLNVPGVRGQAVQMSVSRFYHRKKVALDLFPEGEPDAKEVTLKESLFKSRGIKYFALTPSKSLADLAVYLGA